MYISAPCFLHGVVLPKHQQLQLIFFEWNAMSLRVPWALRHWVQDSRWALRSSKSTTCNKGVSRQTLEIPHMLSSHCMWNDLLSHGSARWGWRRKVGRCTSRELSAKLCLARDLQGWHGRLTCAGWKLVWQVSYERNNWCHRCHEVSLLPEGPNGEECSP